MNRDFEIVLEEATSCLERGEAMEDCLARYPEYAGRLEPLLRMAAFNIQALAHVEPPSEAALATGKQRLLAVAAQLRLQAAAQKKPALQPKGALNLFPLPVRRLATAALVMLLLIVMGGGLVATVGGGLAATSAHSLPGDLLYPVKLATEQAQLLLSFDAQDRDQLLAELAEERRAEVLTILEAGRRVSVKFEGALGGFDDVVWLVSGLEVTLDANTLIVGNPVVGATVAVEALAPGDGSLLALQLAVDSGGETPKPTVTRTPTTTPQPMATPTTTPSPRETHTPHPTDPHEPEPTPTPYATETREPEPTQTPHPPTSTPHPTDTHEPGPTHTPHPTKTREPHPIYTPYPTHTPHPTETHEPEPGHTPHPTDGHDGGDHGGEDGGGHGG